MQLLERSLQDQSHESNRMRSYKALHKILNEGTENDNHKIFKSLGLDDNSLYAMRL